MLHGTAVKIVKKNAGLLKLW